MWYSEGTVAVETGSENVVGTGTSFLTNARVGDGITITGSTALHEIIGVASATQVAIRPAYDGPSGSGLTYGISPILGYDKDLSDAFNSLRLQFGEQLSNLQLWATANTAQEARASLGASESGNTVFTGTPEEGRAALGIRGAAVEGGTWTVQTVEELSGLDALEGDQASVVDVGLFYLSGGVWVQQDGGNQLVTLPSSDTQTISEAINSRVKVGEVGSEVVVVGAEETTLVDAIDSRMPSIRTESGNKVATTIALLPGDVRTNSGVVYVPDGVEVIVEEGAEWRTL